MHRRLVGAALGVPLLLSSTAACTNGMAAAAPQEPTNASAAVKPPDTPIGRQVAWLISASHHLPISKNEAAKHVNLEAFSLKQLNDTLRRTAGSDGLTLRSFRGQNPPEQAKTEGAAVVAGKGGKLFQLIAVTPLGGSDHRLVVVYPRPLPTSWSQLDHRAHAVAPGISVAVARLDRHGRCRKVHGLRADTARPLGSTFKLYVLGALAHAVATGKTSWNEKLAVRNDWKSVGDEPIDRASAGTKFTLRQYADYMIAYSDNSATDHLIHRLGRRAVEAQLARFHMRRPQANIPFATTREFYQLKTNDYPDRARRYVRLGRAGRRAYLRRIDKLPLPKNASWDEPRMIDKIEWFASPNDLCNAYAGLARQARTPAGHPVSRILADQGGSMLALGTKHWPQTWGKGGTEPYVKTITELARDTHGRTYVVAALAGSNDKSKNPGSAASTAELATLSTGAILLASHQSP